MTRYVIEPDVALALAARDPALAAAASKVIAVATGDDLLNGPHDLSRFERRLE